MTDLQLIYAQVRNTGRGHADQIGVDPSTVERALDRADQLDRRDPHRRQRTQGTTTRGR